MQDKVIKIGWILMLIVGLERVALSVILVATGLGDAHAGTLFATIGVATVGISLGSYRKAEKWSWWTLLAIGLMPLLYCTIAHGLMPGNIGDWVLFILAIAIPARAILGKKSTNSST